MAIEPYRFLVEPGAAARSSGRHGRAATSIRARSASTTSLCSAKRTSMRSFSSACRTCPTRTASLPRARLPHRVSGPAERERRSVCRPQPSGEHQRGRHGEPGFAYDFVQRSTAALTFTANIFPGLRDLLNSPNFLSTLTPGWLAAVHVLHPGLGHPDDGGRVRRVSGEDRRIAANEGCERTPNAPAALLLLAASAQPGTTPTCEA